MHISIKIRCIVCVLLLLGGADVFAQCFGSSSSWGYNGLANDYYYGDQNPFQMDDNIFTYGNTATQDMHSTSSAYSPAATFEIAASNIESGTTLADFAMARAAGRTRGRDDHQWETDDQAPIGDGLWILLLLAIGYGGYVYKRDRFAVGS